MGCAADAAGAWPGWFHGGCAADAAGASAGPGVVPQAVQLTPQAPISWPGVVSHSLFVFAFAIRRIQEIKKEPGM